MANTYAQIYLQFVFAVDGRRSLIAPKYREDLNRYITGIVQKRKTKMLAINCMPDHAHIFVGFNPSVLIADLVKEIKVESNEFIKTNKWTREKFNWQEGYGVFSYSHSHIDRVIKYIMNQEEHHRKFSFKEEYLGFLKRFKVEYDERFIFKFHG